MSNIASYASPVTSATRPGVPSVPALLQATSIRPWRAPRGLILSDADPSGLLAQMRQAETVYGGISTLIRRGGEVSPPGPRHHGQQ